MHWRSWPALCWIALLCSPCWAQPAAMNPDLRAYAGAIHDAGHERPLHLRRLDATITQRGTIAEVIVTVSFLNETSDSLEGDFRLKLPAGAVVTGYALDVGLAMVDGVLEDRPRAKAVYEARVRQRVDPGLATVTADNLFETRVSPILPQRGRTIRVRFTVPVGATGLHLPLATEAPRDGWSVTMRATGLAKAPTVTAAGKPIAVTPSDGGYIGRLESGQELSGELAVSVPDSLAAVASRHVTGERFVELHGVLPTADAAKAPAHIRIYWDRARARLGHDTTGEFDLIRRLIATWRPADIELVAFNSSGALRQHVTNAEQALTWLNGLAYRGATSFAAVGADGPADRCLVFSTGRLSIDRAAPITPACSLDTVGASPGDNRAWLAQLSTDNGGRTVTLDDGVAPALSLLTDAATGVATVTDCDGHKQGFALLPARAGQWAVMARAPGVGPLSVTLLNGEHRQIPLPDAAEPFDGAAIPLALDQLARLSTSERRADYVATSRRYSVASPSLSFLVLESAADYVAATVDPPSSLPEEVRAEIARARTEADASKAAAVKVHLDQVASDWAEVVKWWSTKFDPNARPARVTTSRGFDRTELNPPAPPAPPPPPPPPVLAMVPPPAPAAPAAPAVTTQSIIVTAARRNADKGGADQGAIAAPAIQIEAWQPDRPYLELYDGKPADFDSRFLEAEARHGSLPIFYLDTAEWLKRQGRAEAAAEMVLSALDLPTADEVTLGIVADRLERYGAWNRAVELRERQAALDPSRPQPRRLLALTLARRAAAKPALALADLRRAVTLLYAIATTPQDAQWRGVEIVSLEEMNALLPRLRRLGGLATVDPRFIHAIDTDIRVTIDWTTDASDMDLWVDEPTRERAIYNNRRTAIGGLLSPDITRGYGPEAYMLHIAPPGTYTVQANVFAPDRLDPNGPTLLTAHLIRDFGRPTQREESVDVELKQDANGAKMIGRLIVSGATQSKKPS